MKLFIQIRDGITFEHPVMEDNMRQLFPEHDLETAPDGFAKFTRVERPNLSPYEKVDPEQGHEGCGCVYESDDTGGFKDVWHIIPMTVGEKAEKVSRVKGECPYASWIFKEEDCTMNPPLDRPTDGKDYRWDEETISWVERRESDLPTDDDT